MRTNTKSSPLSIRVKMVQGSVVQITAMNAATGNIYVTRLDVLKPIRQDVSFDDLEKQKDEEIQESNETDENDIIEEVNPIVEESDDAEIVSEISTKEEEKGDQDVHD